MDEMLSENCCQTILKTVILSVNSCDKPAFLETLFRDITRLSKVSGIVAGINVTDMTFRFTCAPRRVPEYCNLIIQLK